ncbi:unnamed protein product [Orchesella dallaii]|uniref:Uncharacterized protein n=1 Tax=Orchesella dallaii TaxID=48710 RepID=A0ABP1PSX3_9HEXA
MATFRSIFGPVPLKAVILIVVVFVMMCGVPTSSLNIGPLINMINSGNKDGVNGTDILMKRAGEFASRALWMNRGKLIFPKGTIIVLTPQITIPGFRKKPYKGGLNSDIQLSIPLYVNLDKMGYTHEMHPFPFDRPPFWPFGPIRRPIGDEEEKTTPKPDPMMMGMDMYNHATSMKMPMKKPTSKQPEIEDEDEEYKFYKGGRGSVAGGGGGTTVYKYIPIGKRTGSGEQQQQQQRFKSQESGGRVRNRNPRSIMALPPPESLRGGDRAHILPRIEEMLGDVGLDGRACMLRAICEVHEFPLQEGYGLFGDLIAWFFTISQSPYAKSHMREYLRAEDAGRGGNCEEYKKMCSKSLFKWEMEKAPDYNEL